MTDTLDELVTKVTRRLSQVPGVGVQLYAEDRIVDMIQHKFDILFDELFWPQFSGWYQWTLDGSTGVITTDVSTILKRFDDIDVIFLPNSDSPLPKLPDRVVNPFQLTGQTPLYYDANPGSTSRPFLVWPKTATGTIDVHVRTKPDDFIGDSIVDFDNQALILGTVFDYLDPYRGSCETSKSQNSLTSLTVHETGPFLN